MNCYFRLSPIKYYLKIFITSSNVKTSTNKKIIMSGAHAERGSPKFVN